MIPSESASILKFHSDVTCTSVGRADIPAFAGQLVISAYIFSNEVECHGVALTLDYRNEISIKFECETRSVTEALESKDEGADGAWLQTLPYPFLRWLGIRQSQG